MLVSGHKDAFLQIQREKSAAEYLKDLSMEKVWVFSKCAISDHMTQI